MIFPRVNAWSNGISFDDYQFVLLQTPMSLEQLLEESIREKEECIANLKRSREQARELLKLSSESLLNAVDPDSIEDNYQLS